MFERVDKFFNDREFRFTIYEDKIHIINFKRIISLEANNISFQSNKHKIHIMGSNLVVRRLLEEEILISGNISKIEVINE